MEPARKETERGPVQLGLWDVTSIIVGIIIGVGIFETPQKIFAAAPNAWAAMGVWALGGVLALVGALCFAELASAYPHSGGEYVYLTKSYGSLVGFLYAWAQLAVIRPASIAALAYIFADHAQVFLPWPPLLLALGAVAVLTLINILGVVLGTVTQNLLTIGKLLGIAAIIVVGLLLSDLQMPAPSASRVPPETSWFAAAMIMVLWTYAGWHEAAYIAAEVKHSRRNLPLSLIFGTLAVTVIYLLVNGAVLLALGFEGARMNSPVDVLKGNLGRAVNLLIMVSALGAINGMIFTTSRIFSAFGQDHRVYASLSHWSRRLGTPTRALVVQGLIGLGYLLAGVVTEAIKWLLADAETRGPLLEILTAERSLKSLDYWIQLTAAVFWAFFMLTGLALFVLRVKDPDAPRPFRVPLYPVLPLVFCLWCGYMVYGSIRTAPNESLFGLLVLLLGLPFYYLPQKKKRVPRDEPVGPLVGAGQG